MAKRPTQVGDSHFESNPTVFNGGHRQKLREGAKGLHRKDWTWTKMFSYNICYLVAILRFVAMFAFYKAFIELWMQDMFANKSKSYIFCCDLGNTRQTMFFGELANTRSTKELNVFFRLRRKPANFCHPDVRKQERTTYGQNKNRKNWESCPSLTNNSQSGSNVSLISSLRVALSFVYLFCLPRLSCFSCLICKSS